MSGVQGGSGRGLPSEAPSDPERRGMGGIGKDPPPPHTPHGGPQLPVFLHKDTGHNLVPGGGVLGVGDGPDQPMGIFCAPSRAGYICDIGGR